MPRDLESEHQTIEGLAPLSRIDDRPSADTSDAKSPPIIQSPESMDARSDDEEPRDVLLRDMQRGDKRNAFAHIQSHCYLEVWLPKLCQGLFSWSFTPCQRNLLAAVSTRQQPAPGSSTRRKGLPAEQKI